MDDLLSSFNLYWDNINIFNLDIENYDYFNFFNETNLFYIYLGYHKSDYFLNENLNYYYYFEFDDLLSDVNNDFLFYEDEISEFELPNIFDYEFSFYENFYFLNRLYLG
jgi:hypothetical protein